MLEFFHSINLISILTYNNCNPTTFSYPRKNNLMRKIPTKAGCSASHEI